MCIAYIGKCFEVSWLLGSRLKDLDIMIKTARSQNWDARMRLQHVYLHRHISISNTVIIIVITIITISCSIISIIIISSRVGRLKSMRFKLI